MVVWIQRTFVACTIPPNSPTSTDRQTAIVPNDMETEVFCDMTRPDFDRFVTTLGLMPKTSVSLWSVLVAYILSISNPI